MNCCNFIGKILGKLHLDNENGTSVVRFYVSVEEARKDNKTGEKKKMYTSLGFEAWDTGAEAICANCQTGDMIGIEANARYDEEADEVYFRVKSFKVFK